MADHAPPHTAPAPPHPWGPKMRIGKVYIKGNKRTKPEVFENELQTAYEADRIGYIVEGLKTATGGLVALDIFDAVDFKLDKSSSGKVDETDVTITVKEKSWRKLHVGATTDGNEETAETSCTLVNGLGQAEKLTVSASYAMTGSNTERATLEKPRFMGLPLYMHASASNELHSHERLSSYNEKIRGGTFSISDYGGFHELSLNLGWRDIIPRRDSKIPTAFRASPSIIAEAMPSTKTSVKYVFKDDSRNNNVVPTRGGLFQYSTEVAGFLGDVQFVKAEVAAQKHFGVGPQLFGNPILSFSFASQLGAIKSYGLDESRPTRLSDRFFLGGPLSVRGFNHKGIGPRASPSDGGAKAGDSLGGDFCYTASASMGFPLPVPLMAMLGMRGQLFANAGNLTTWSRLLDEKKWMKHMVDDTRVSVGVGIVWGTSIGRIEANYSWILKSHHNQTPGTNTMYSTGGGVANGGRIHNPRPDPAEMGPPRRVNREESHVGEMVAASKRRIAWTFTLGESDTIHEVVLSHSKLTYKKLVEFDGRQMHFSSSATPGDWSYTMFLDNTKYAIEVRINDLESADVPKYDLVIDRVPFRRWDVYRRRKQPLNGGAAVPGTYGGHHQQYQPHHQQASAQSSGGGDSFGKHKWGPSGMTAPSPMEVSPPAHAQRNSGSFFRGESSNSSYQSPPPPAPGQYNGATPQRQSFHGAPAPVPSAAPAKKPPQKEIDLLGDFGSTDASTVTAQQLIFDPLAGTKLGAAPQQPNRTASSPMMPAAMQPQGNMRTASNPQMGYPQQQQPYVDPFAHVAQPVPIKPAASSFNLDPLASQNSMYMQQNRAAPVGMPSYPVYQPPQGGMPRGMPMQQQQQPQPPMQGGFPVPAGTMSNVNAGYQPPKVGGGAGGANYNISHLMNPMEVNNVRNAQQTKTINIDPFAGMHHK